MRRLGIIIPLLALTGSSWAQQSLVLDDFDSLQNDARGGMRDVSLDVLANPFSQNTTFSVQPGFTFGATNGALVFNAGISVRQTGTITWGHENQLNLDLSEALGLELDFLQIDQSFEMTVLATSGTSGSTASWAGTVAASSISKTELVGFQEFEFDETFDPTDVDSFTIMFNTGDPVSSLDFVLGEIRGGVIPAPASAAMLGLSGLAVCRRRRRA